MATFGGDEVGAIVLDLGTGSVRAGYAGEEAPYHVLPSCVAFNTDQAASGSSDVESTMEVDGDGENTAKAPRKSKGKGHKPCSAMIPVKDSYDIRKPIEDKLIADWDGLEVLLDHLYENEFRTSPEEHPLLVTEASWNSTANRERLTEVVFEKYKVPAFYVAKQSVCAAFSTARPTSLVVDISESGTSVVPVYDGYVLSQGIMRNNIGGRAVRQMFRDNVLKAQKGKLVPTYQVQSKKQVKEGANAHYTKRTWPFTVSPVYHNMAVDAVVDHFTESVAKVAPRRYEETVMAQVPYEPFEFPSGFHMGFGPERFRTTEGLFDPKQFAPESLRGEGLGVVDMIVESIQRCDADARQILYNNIVVTGGTSLISGLVERINNDLEIQAFAGGRFKVQAATSTVERRHATWIGGSILGSLGTFQQMWISGKEYEENGASIVGTKCS